MLVRGIGQYPVQVPRLSSKRERYCRLRRCISRGIRCGSCFRHGSDPTTEVCLSLGGALRIPVGRAPYPASRRRENVSRDCGVGFNADLRILLTRRPRLIRRFFGSGDGALDAVRARGRPDEVWTAAKYACTFPEFCSGCSCRLEPFWGVGRLLVASVAV